MARANVHNEYKEKNKSHKKLWAIISSVGVVVVAGIVLLILWLVGVFDSKDIPTYLTKYDEYKINYSQLSSKLSDTESTFIFVYDNEAYDELSDSNKTTIETRITNLIESINKVNEEKDAEVFNFYIIDTTVSSNANILENDSYGSFTFTPQLMYFYNGTYYANMEAACDANNNLASQVSEDDKDIVFTNDSIGGLINNLSEARSLIDNIR